MATKRKGAGQQHAVRLVDTTRAWLSDHAVTVLEALDIRRDPERTVDGDTLRELLAARGLPAYPAAVEIERVAGGAQLAAGSYVGVFASLWAAEVQRPPLPGDPNWPGAAAHKRAARAPASKLVIVDRSAAVDERGIIHLVWDDDDFGYTSPAFDSFAQYLEVFALVPSGSDVSWHRVRVDATAGADLAAVLGAEPFAPASGSWCRAWLGEAIGILEAHVDGFPIDTRIATPDTARAVATVKAALDISGDVEWSSPAGRAAGLPPPAQRCRREGREILVWGAPSDFGWDQARAHWYKLHGHRNSD